MGAGYCTISPLGWKTPPSYSDRELLLEHSWLYTQHLSLTPSGWGLPPLSVCLMGLSAACAGWTWHLPLGWTHQDHHELHWHGPGSRRNTALDPDDLHDSLGSLQPSWSQKDVAQISTEGCGRSLQSRSWQVFWAGLHHHLLVLLHIWHTVLDR